MKIETERSWNMAWLIYGDCACFCEEILDESKIHFVFEFNHELKMSLRIVWIKSVIWWTMVFEWINIVFDIIICEINIKTYDK